MATVLIVEDDARIRANLVFQLKEADLRPMAVASAESALLELEAADVLPDLLLVDVRLSGMSGVELVRQLADAGNLPPTIIISGEASISETVEALRLGVHDFLEKPFNRERLIQSIRNTLDHTALQEEVEQLRCELEAQTQILGESPSIHALHQQIARVARTDATVLIRGESGTGKELVATAVQRQSLRSSGPFVRINCGAIPPQLVEDELFGHVRGAFTDARGDKAGLFEEADGGTLFLDEIGDMEMPLQSRLLRVLEDGRVRRLGETRDRRVDVRILVATHADLELAIEEKRFREDLYYRLAGLPIDVPPLRERRSDIPILFRHFLEVLARRHRVRARRVDAAVYPVLEAYPWPGNVRELRGVCERLVVFGADRITLDQLPGSLREPPPTDVGRLLAIETGAPILPFREFKAAVEKEYLEHVLDRTGWNVSAAARLLGIRRTHLHQKLNSLGSRRPGAAPPEEEG